MPRFFSRKKYSLPLLDNAAGRLKNSVHLTNRLISSLHPLLRRLLPPLAVMLLLLFASGISLLWWQYYLHMNERIERARNNIITGLRQTTHTTAATLEGILQSIAADSRLQQALHAGDIDQLSHDWNPVFKRIKEEHRLCEFRFLDREQRCLLCFHEPTPRHSSDQAAERLIVRRAATTLDMAHGIELAPSGHLTLRVVKPVFRNAGLVGFIELAKDIGWMLQAHRYEGVMLGIAVQKQYINRQQWLAQGHLPAEWERHPDSLLLYSSDEMLRENFSAQINHHPAHGHVDCKNTDIAVDGRYWRFVSDAVSDASGRTVGCLLIMLDITREKAAFHKVLRIGTICGGAVLAGLLLFVYSLARRIDMGVREQQRILEENEKRFTQLALQSRTIVWDIDLEGRFTYVNSAIELVLGYRPDEVINRMSFYDLSPRERREDLKKEALSAFTGNHNLRNFECELKSKNGRLLFFLTHGIPLLNPDGTVAGYRGESFDISDRKQVERELLRQMRFQEILVRISSTFINQSREHFDEAIDKSLADLGRFMNVDRFYLFDYDFDKKICNNTHEWCATGIEPQIDKLQAVPLAAVPEWVETHQRGETIFIPDVAALPPKDGVRQILEPQQIKSLITVPLNDGDRCLGFTGFDSVQACHRYSETEHRLLRIFSQMLVNVRKRYETEEALLKSRDRAEAADRTKNIFLTNMSHELRTPINGMIAAAELLRETPLQREQLEYANIIGSSGKLLLELVNELLDFSSIEAGTIKLRPTDFSPRKVFNSLIDAMATTIHAKKLELHCNISPEIPGKLHGDASRLQEIVTNLLGNAIKFTDSGSVTFSATIENKTPKTVFLRFSVCDTGSGIPQEQHQALFGAFFQADASVKRRHGGVGLGLSIAQRLVELMGGRLELASKSGVGSEFFFTLPFGYSAEPDEPGITPPEEPAISQHALPPSSRETENFELLIVEDNFTNQQVMLAIIKKIGGNADIAANGAEALELLAGKRYHVVLMDIQMPVMDGLEATRKIRAPETPVLNNDVPIIAVTAHATDEYREKCLEAGMNDFLAKPVTPNKLREILCRWLPL